MSQNSRPLVFKIYKGDELLREETLSQSVIKVGKLSSSHLRLDDESVSRMHAVIEVTGDDDISIIDLGSTKGTVVNGQKVNKAKLEVGDKIELGELRIEFSLGGASVHDEATVEEGFGEGVESDIAAPPVVSPAAGMAPAVGAPKAGAPLPVGGQSPAALSHGMSAPPSGASGPPPQFGLDAADDVGGDRAIEVAAMLGDSVVDVKHVMNPKGGKVQAATYALFAVGTALVLLSIFAFFSGVSNADYNKRLYHRHVEVDKRPVHEFRPRRLSMLYDWLAVGGGLGGVFCLTTGLVRIRNEKIEPYYRIGDAPGVDLPTGISPSESFALVAPSGDDFVFNFSSDWEGDLTLDGTVTPLSALQESGGARASSTQSGAIEASIPHRGRFRVQKGNQSFLVSSVPKPKEHPVPFLANLETSFLAYVGGAALMVFGFIALIFSIPPEAGTLAWTDFEGDGRLAEVQAKPDEDPLQEEEETDDGDDADEGGTGTKMALDEGKMGKTESTRATGQFAMKNNDADPQLAKQQAIDAARTSGILGLMKADQGGAFASLTGAADFSSGLDDRDVYGGLLGNEVGEMAGGFGYGVSGVGPGGGGTGWGTVGTGQYGKIGHGSGTGSGYGSGSGRGGPGGRKSTPPKVRLANASVNGDLDKEIIRRYIRRKLPRIQHCYEKELVVKPQLSGTVTTQFQISPQGGVQGATASGIGNGNVEGCVADAIKSIQFPKPKGGGYVNVRYPFNFQPAGG